jgi:hypothetical protein
MLEKGTTYNKCQDEIDMLWGVPDTTFTRYWKEANARFKAMHAEIQENYKNVLKDSVEARQKLGILSKLERMKILSDIAQGEIVLTKYIVCDGVIQERDVVPDYNDRKGAIAELNKMDGDYAPVKKDITSGGKEIKAITGIRVE